MPPKVKITKEEIIRTAVDLVRTSGAQAMNARAVAAALNCSTQPIFSNFATMEELQRAVIDHAYTYYLGYLQEAASKGEYPRYKAAGMAYIRFAKEEKELFRLLFMRDRTAEETADPDDFKEWVRTQMESNGVTREVAAIMHLEMWAFVHGIATMLVTSFLPLEWDLISNMLTDVYRGIQARYVTEEKTI